MIEKVFLREMMYNCFMIVVDKRLNKTEHFTNILPQSIT